MTAILWQRFLAQAASARPADTLEPVFEAERGAVWTICARILGPGEDAEEAFQTAWARVLADTRAGRIAAPDAHDHLLRTARRAAEAHRMSLRKRRQRETAMQHAPDLIHTAPGPESALGESERRAAMEALVAQLPPNLRLPVQLHYLNGMTQRDVAMALGVPLSTLHSRLKAALNRLRPLAERAGLRDTLGMLGVGGLSAGLLMPPSGLTAAGVMSVSTTTAVAAGMFSTVTAKIAAIAAVVVVALSIGVGTIWPKSPESISATKGIAAEVANAVDAEEKTPAPEREQPIAEPEEVAMADAAATVTGEEKAPAPPTRFLSVLVVDKASGEPLRDAWTRLRGPGYERMRFSNREGIARYDDAPLGSVRLEARAEGYAQDGLHIEVGSTDPVVTLELRPGAILHGRVLQANGEPARDTEVFVSNNSMSSLAGRTDEEGRYEIAHVARGALLQRISVSHPGHKVFLRAEEITIPAESERFEFNVTLEPLAVSRLEGIVVDARTGAPIMGARLRGDQGWSSESLDETDEAGAFAIENFAAFNNQILFGA